MFIGRDSVSYIYFRRRQRFLFQDLVQFEVVDASLVAKMLSMISKNTRIYEVLRIRFTLQRIR